VTDSRKRRSAGARAGNPSPAKPGPAKPRPAKPRPAKPRPVPAPAKKAPAKTTATAASRTSVTRGAARGTVTATGPRLKAEDKAAFPLPKTSFRVFIGPEEVHVVSVSPLHLADKEFTDPDLRQTVVLRRAVSNSRTFYDWNFACRAGKNDKRTVTITLLDRPGGKPACIWQLANAEAVRWTGPDLNAMAHEIAMEELELIYETIAWRSGI